jgi:ubiquinone/menaquinone biosynthesis C-methylase UbiE
MGENSSTYFVQDKKNKKEELTRLTIQDQIATSAMGGVLSEQADPTVFRRVLDIACGTGGWLIKAARTYPVIEELVGIDISQQMIKYAQSQAEANQVNDRIEFRVMDALQTLDFPADSFDLVNLRFGLSFLRTWDWSKLLSGLLRVTRPGGIVRITENELILQSNSPALMRLCKMALCAFFRAGHLFEEESTGLTDHLPRLLSHYGCKPVQTKAYPIEYRAGTKEAKAFYEDTRLVFQTLQPFIEKRGCATQDYKTLYRHALEEMRRSDFRVTWNILTAWGCKA